MHPMSCCERHAVPHLAGVQGRHRSTGWPRGSVCMLARSAGPLAVHPVMPAQSSSDSPRSSLWPCSRRAAEQHECSALQTCIPHAVVAVMQGGNLLSGTLPDMSAMKALTDFNAPNNQISGTLPQVSLSAA